MPREQKYILVPVDKVVAATDMALLLEVDGEEYWVPKSQMEDPDEFVRGDRNVEIFMTEWIAKQKGLD